MDITKLTTNPDMTENFSMQQIADVDELQLNLVRLKAGKDLPAHNANSNVRLLVLEGELTIVANGEEGKAGMHSIANVAYNTPMQLRNLGDTDVVFVVIKTPNPRMMR